MTENLITNENGEFIIRVNSKLYPVEAIYSAAYVFLDKAFVKLDGDPEGEVKVIIKPKDSKDKMIAHEFYNELLNYSEYLTRSAETKRLREMIIQRAILSNDPEAISNDEEFEALLRELEQEENNPDCDDAVVPWEK